jgi:perosamine synthetase
MIRYPVSKPCLTDLEMFEVCQAMSECRLSKGKSVAEFERQLSFYLRVPHVVMTTSGTTALHLALAALRIGRGDEVIVPDLTYVATATAVSYTGAKVVLVDVDDTGCIDVADVARHISSRTKAIIPVHLYGVPCDMDRLLRFGIPIVEDAAEGFGGWHGVDKLGTHGTCGIFSFYANKIITTGEGGAVVTHDPALADRLRYLRGMAQDPARRYFHTEVGFNYRPTDIQGAIGCGQMQHVEAIVSQRLRVCNTYSERLLGEPWPRGHAPWLFTLELPDDISVPDFQVKLDAKGIDTRPVFTPLHTMPMYHDQGGRWQFEYSDRFARQGLSLPTYPELTDYDVNYICGMFEDVHRSI